VVGAALRATSLVTVDSQGSLADFRGLTLIKCNQAEAEFSLGESLDDPEDRRRLLTMLRHKLNCGRLVVTLGPAGAALASCDGRYDEVSPQVRRQVFDVTGAGDTVIAVLTAALAAGGSALSALRLSQVAAGLAVAKWGNAQVLASEIEAALASG
jgi:D-glycero-beta-D-manno-heptose-7-phosphate kinase